MSLAPKIGDMVNLVKAQFIVILDYLHTSRGFDFSVSRYSSLERKINNRLSQLKMDRAQQYIKFLETYPNEWITLIDLLTINVSRFFRNALTFETLAKKILPNLIIHKAKTDSTGIRIWSAGCASGEEPYSIAVLIHEILRKEHLDLDVTIFATDISKSILSKARKGCFVENQLVNVKLSLLNKYFIKDQNHYLLDEKIKEMVSFSYYDIIDPKTYVPPESLFGNFDIVLCRNLLIYFRQNHQTIIFNKLFRALSSNAFLVLGEAEQLPTKYQDQFEKENDYCHIYRKTF